MDTAQLPLLLTILTSVAVIVWRFSSVATKLEKLTEEVRDLLKDFKEHRTLMTRLESELSTLANNLQKLESRVDKLGD